MNAYIAQWAQAEPGTLSPVALFFEADIVVKLVIIGLILASIWTWGIIIAQVIKQRQIRQASAQFERNFWATKDIDGFASEQKDRSHPMAKVLTAGLAEWRLSTNRATVDKDGTRARLGTALGAASAIEIDRLSDRLNYLATIGAVAPFVGLFGTVWGIMRAFAGIAAQQNTSLAVVAPGIAEALFATALGLFAAIPAVIAYNRLSHGINRIEARLNRFADGFHATLSRELDD